MGKISNGESTCGSLRADLGWPLFFSPLLYVVGRPVIFSVGRNEPSGRCSGTRVSAYPDRIGAHSISALARSVCWSEQQRLEVIGRRLDTGSEGIRRTYGDPRGAKPSSKPLNWPLLAAQALPNSPLLNLPIRQEWKENTSMPHASQRHTWPPSAAVRQSGCPRWRVDAMAAPTCREPRGSPPRSGGTRRRPRS
jgi:hypothetical protein